MKHNRVWHVPSEQWCKILLLQQLAAVLLLIGPRGPASSICFFCVEEEECINSSLKVYLL